MKILSKDLKNLIFYHGTTENFSTFDFGKAKPMKDFGKGFYLTTNLGQAFVWAAKNLRNGDAGTCYVQEYKVVDSTIILEAREFKEYNEDWLQFVSLCRKGKEPNELYDIVYDRMADSTSEIINELIDMYLRAKHVGTEHTYLPYILKELSKWNDCTYDQYCFKTKLALSSIKLNRVFTVDVC